MDRPTNIFISPEVFPPLGRAVSQEWKSSLRSSRRITPADDSPEKRRDSPGPPPPPPAPAPTPLVPLDRGAALPATALTPSPPRSPLSGPCYFDYNASTPVAPEVLAAMLPFLSHAHPGNPCSSSHEYGLRARAAVEDARAGVAALIHADPSEIYFTSGGTEANNWVLRGARAAHATLTHRRRPGPKSPTPTVVTSAIEHPAVIAVLARMSTETGVDVIKLPVDSAGHCWPGPAATAAVARPGTYLLSVMLANNEVGSLQPVKQLVALARSYGVLSHSDASQAVGKVPVDVRTLGVDYLTIAGHKMYAPHGVGALYIRSGSPVPTPLLVGGSQERGARAGTPAVALTVALGAAARLCGANLGEAAEHAAGMRERLRAEIVSRLPGRLCVVNGPMHPARRLPNTLSVSFRAVDAGALLAAAAADVAASAGAACHAGGTSVSPVLSAMRIPPEFARGTVRLSVGRWTTAAECTRVADALARAVRRLRGDGAIDAELKAHAAAEAAEAAEAVAAEKAKSEAVDDAVESEAASESIRQSVVRPVGPAMGGPRGGGRLRGWLGVIASAAVLAASVVLMLPRGEGGGGHPTPAPGKKGKKGKKGKRGQRPAGTGPAVGGQGDGAGRLAPTGWSLFPPARPAATAAGDS